MLPIISGDEARKVFQKKGYSFDHQVGNHMILRSSVPPFRMLTIPNHGKLARGTLETLIYEAGMTIKEFAHLLRI